MQICSGRSTGSFHILCEMKRLLLLLCLFLCAVLAFGSDVPMEINLLDGSRIKGRVMSASATELTFLTDFGVSRIPLEKLTADSRQAITIGAKPDTEALLKRISELEARVSQLQQENEALRRQAVAPPSPSYRPPAGGNSLTPSATPQQQPASSGMSYTISSTGKRHNSGCRYFGSGRPCGATDGIACKICGG